jgi:hypothetical protein
MAPMTTDDDIANAIAVEARELILRRVSEARGSRRLYVLAVARLVLATLEAEAGEADPLVADLFSEIASAAADLRAGF